MFDLGRIIEKLVGAISIIALTSLLFTSCDVYDSLPPCPRGLKVHFVYDYNMEYADAFHSQVDCLTLLVYDEKGHLLKTIEKQGEPLTHKEFCIPVDLKHGKYHLVAPGGLACENASFHPVVSPMEGSPLSQLEITLNHEAKVSSAWLHPFFHGSAEVVVEGEMYKDVTIYLVRNTNQVRVMLQQTDGSPIDDADFDFCIYDDNGLFDADNQLIPAGGMTYYPCSRGTVGLDEQDPSVNLMAAYAEFSTSRFSARANNRLTVSRKSDGIRVIDLPLSAMLLMVKSDLYNSMEAQEYLDRENNWTLVFFLTSGGLWIQTHIVVNGWTVRLNETNL